MTTSLEWSLRIPGKITSKGNSKRAFVSKGGRAFVVNSSQATKAEASVRAFAAAHAPAAPFRGAIMLDALFVFSIPQGARGGPRSTPRLFAGDPCLKHFDRGNALKLLEDALKGIAYSDDALVVAGPVGKVWGYDEEIRVRVVQLIGPDVDRAVAWATKGSGGAR